MNISIDVLYMFVLYKLWFRKYIHYRLILYVIENETSKETSQDNFNK